MRLLIGFVLLYMCIPYAQARISLGQLEKELSVLSVTCFGKQKQIQVLLESAEVHLICGNQIQKLKAVVVARHKFHHNYPVLPRTTYMTNVELFPTWKRTKSMVAESCKKGRCASDRVYYHGQSSNPFNLGKIFLEGMGAIRIHDVAQSQKKRLRVFEKEIDRYASSGCVNLKTQSLMRLLAFIGFDPLDRSNDSYKNIPVIFTNG